MPFLIETNVSDLCKWRQREDVLSSLSVETSLLYVPPSFRSRIKSTGVVKSALIPVPRKNDSILRQRLFTESLDENAVYLMIQANEETTRAMIDLVQNEDINGLEILDCFEHILYALRGVELMVEEAEQMQLNERSLVVAAKPASVRFFK